MLIETRKAADGHDDHLLCEEASLIVPIAEIRHLRCFLAVVEDLDLGRAPLASTSPAHAVSQTIRRLECGRMRSAVGRGPSTLASLYRYCEQE